MPPIVKNYATGFCVSIIKGALLRIKAFASLRRRRKKIVAFFMNKLFNVLAESISKK